MYKPKKLHLINLLSHTNTVYEFKDGVAVLIVGENRDDDGQESNGSGKSGIIEGISISLTASPFRKVKDCDLIHYGEERAVVITEWENKVLNTTLKIERTLFSNKNKSSTLRVWIDGKEEKKAFPTVREGNKWLLSLLGVSREDLINYFIVSKSKSISFFGQSDSDKKKIVSRFSGTEPLLPIKDKVSEDIKEIEEEKSTLQNQLLTLEGKREAYSEQITLSSTEDQKKLKEARIKNREEAIADNLSTAERLSKEVSTAGGRLEKSKEVIRVAESLVESLPKLDLTNQLSVIKRKETSNSKDIETVEGEIRTFLPDLREYKSFKTEIEQNLADSIECPSCRHTFILRDKSYDLKAAKELLPMVSDMILQIEKSILARESELLKLRDTQTEISSQMSELRKKDRESKDKLAVLQSDVRSKKGLAESIKISLDLNKEKLLQLEISTKEVMKEIEGIRSEKIIDPSLETSKRIKKNDDSIDAKLLEIDKAKDKYIRLKEFEGVFIRFITHLSNKAVKAIEVRSNLYLENMGSNLSIGIEGYKVNSDGSIREKFTTIVSRDGIPEAFLEGYSEGEFSRVNIASILAVNSLVNSSCSYGKGIDLVVLDELMGSLDRLGVGLTMEALDKLNQTILAISHVEPRNNYRETVTVLKEGGYSRIK